MYNEAELVHWMRNRDAMKLIPASVDIDLTNICNQDCFYCNSAVWREQAPVQKKSHNYIELLDKLSTWRVHTPNSYGTLHTITYPGGGEPTVLKGFEEVIEYTIDLRFLTSITTNGSKLDKLFDMDINKLKKIGWIGIDIDAGDEDTYEKIRRSLVKGGLFYRVKDNAKTLVEMGVNVDLKILLNEYNDNPKAIENIFAYCKEVGARQLFFRPVILNHDSSNSGGEEIHIITEETLKFIESMSQKYAVRYKVNMSKYEPRNYKKCHQMYHFPVFCAEGGIYTCCENKGNPDFKIGSWLEGDFRDIWMEERHNQIYESIDVTKCMPCRPNQANINIQNVINDDTKIETLYK